MGWKINPTSLRAGLTQHLGSEPTEDQMSQSLQIVDRMARVSGDDSVLEKRELYLAAQELLAARQSGEFHYLLWQNPRLASATLMTVDQLLRPKKSLVSNDENNIQPIDNVGLWPEFIESLALPSPSSFDRLLAGARLTHETFSVVFQDRFRDGAFLMTMPGDGIDIRFNTLIGNLIKVAEKLADSVRMVEAKQGESDSRQRKLESKFGIKGMPVPLSATDLYESIRELGSIPLGSDKEALNYLSDNKDAQKALVDTLRFIMAHGDKRNARDASEALSVLTTGLYNFRSKFPVSQPNRNFPRFDGDNRIDVIKFLKEDMALPIEDQETEDRVWYYWSRAWHQDGVKPGDFEMDLDKTSFEYKMGAWWTLAGKEEVSFRYIMVSLAALAYKYRKPHNITSHTHRARIVDLANEPGLQLLKFVYFLRMPGDPPVRQEELRSLDKSVTTFERLTHGETEMLRDFVRAGTPITDLMQRDADQDMVRVVNRAFLSLGLSKSIVEIVRAFGRKIFRRPGKSVKEVGRELGHFLSMVVRGHKDLAVIKKDGKLNPGSVLIDDTRAENAMFLQSGGASTIRVPKKMAKAGSEFEGSQLVVDVLIGIFQSIRSRIPAEDIKKVFKAIDHVFVNQKIFVNHRDWALKAYYGWLNGMIPLQRQKASARIHGVASLPRQTVQEFTQQLGMGHPAFEEAITPAIEISEVEPINGQGEIPADEAPLPEVISGNSGLLPIGMMQGPLNTLRP